MAFIFQIFLKLIKLPGFGSNTPVCALLWVKFSVVSLGAKITPSVQHVTAVGRKTSKSPPPPDKFKYRRSHCTQCSQ